MHYKDYLFDGINNPDIFKSIDVKRSIICNSNKYEITWFCQDSSVTSEMIYSLLDDEGISILRNSDFYLSKIYGIISCGKDVSKLFDNEVFLDMLFELNDYYFYLKENEAVKFINYCIDNSLGVIRVFNMLNEKSQVSVINNCDMKEYYYDLLVRSKLECSKLIIDSIYSLENYNYFDLSNIFEKDMVIPERLLNSSLVNRISSIYNVKNYRNLVSKLGRNNDISSIEKLRIKYYDYFLKECFLIFNNILSEFKDGVSLDVVLNKYLNSFGGYDSILSDLYEKSDFDDRLIKSFNYVTTDIVIDYVFHDFTYNVFLDISELIRFDKSTDVLNDFDKKIYSDIISLDSMSFSEKRNLLDNLKSINIESKFYDDYKKAQNKMVELFNSSILNKENVVKYINDDLSNKYGVPIYEIDGDPFYVFVKSLQVCKDSILSEEYLRSYCDSASFSIDGGNKLRTFGDPNLYYNLVYNRIPDNQLIHTFEVDSFSKYYRDCNDVPRNCNGTDRINRLYTPEQVTGISSSYNELIVAQPNEYKNTEFNSKLEKIVPFAIYCYDKFSDYDILSAKALGLGIIVVRTNKYDINDSSRVSLHSLNDGDICYVKPSESDYSRRL